MASRRLDISSLLCDDNSPPKQQQARSQSPPPITPKPVPQPIVLAPHLRSNQRQYAQRVLSVFDPSHPYSDYTKDSDRSIGSARYHTPSPPVAQDVPSATRRNMYADYPEQDMDPPRPSRLRVQDEQQAPAHKAAVHYRSPHSTESAYHLPRPSSSRSSNSPLISYTYPPPPPPRPTVSPSASPSPYNVRPPPGRFSPPGVPSQHESSSPRAYHANFHHSPTLSRPSHVQSHPLAPPQPRQSSTSQSRSVTDSSPKMHLFSLPPSTSQAHPNPRSQPQSTSPPMAHIGNKPPYVGLDALVHAASEERRRLSGGSSGELETSGRVTTPSEETRPRLHGIVERQPPPQQPYQQQSRPRVPERTGLGEPYIQTQMQRNTSISPSEYNLRTASFPPLNQQQQMIQQPQSMHHRERDGHMQTALSPAEDSGHQAAPTPYSPLPSRHHQDQEQQRIRHQRHHHEQLQQQEHMQQLLSLRRPQERTVGYSEGSPPLTSMRRNSHSSHFRSRPDPQRPARKSDPGQVRRVMSPLHATAHQPTEPTHLSHHPTAESRPSKKRRYSDSHSRTVSDESADRKGRLQLDQDRMMTAAADVGHTMVEVMALLRRPEPEQRRTKRHPVVEESLLIERERERIGAWAGIEGREMRESDGDVVRSPPGSHIGRVKARKSEDMDLGVKRKEHVHEMNDKEVEEPLDGKKDTKKPRSEIHVESLGPSRVKYENEQHQHQPHPRPKPHEEDAHEWFLEHYDESPPPADTHEKPCRPRPPTPLKVVTTSLPPPVPVLSSAKSLSPVIKKRTPTPTPTTMPEAAVALEQELEEVVVGGEVGKLEPGVDMDIDVDLAVTELVAETLGGNDEGKRDDEAMEVDDVEDELLSLVDDRPLPIAHAPSRRVSSGSAPGSTPAPSTSRAPKPPALRLVNNSDSRHASPQVVSAISAPSPSAFLSPVVRASSSARPTPDRGSMPPPVSTNVGPAGSSRAKDKDEGGKQGNRAGSVASTSTAAPSGTKKKKDGAGKPGPKPKTAPPAKPRGKPGPKPKPRNSDGSIATPAAKAPKASALPSAKRGATAAASRSRSTSVMPRGSVGPEGDTKEEEEEEEEARNEDHKLYCVCKTKYDEDRIMIACDRCDEWYHTQCVNMTDLEVDLVDQFICPPCIEKNPHLCLQTTYKRRCLFGLKHWDPDSPRACHKPARGAFSKYCSDECGVKYMQTRIDAWAKKGGKTEKLWESVKDAEKREGVVVCAEEVLANANAKTEDEPRRAADSKSKEGKVEREVEQLNTLLDQVVKLREEIKKGMEVVVWRERLLELASERAEHVGQCGWDQRLCFGDEEWADFGAGVLESYEEIAIDVKAEDDDMKADPVAEGDGEWWCPGKKMCERHAGWQTVRYKDVCKEKEKKEEALLKLTTREREIRKRIEDLVDPHRRNCNDTPAKTPLKSSNTKLSNGHTRAKSNGDLVKKGKKRKASAS